MSKRIALSEDKVSADFHKKLMLVKQPAVQQAIVNLFDGMPSRRKCYKLKDLDFAPHATEFFVDGFFNVVEIASMMQLQVADGDKNSDIIVRLYELDKSLGGELTADEIKAKLLSITTSDLKNGALVNIVPELIYAYISRAQPTLLALKLEYFFGSLVVDVMSAHGKQVDMGAARKHPERAAKRAMKGLATN